MASGNTMCLSHANIELQEYKEVPGATDGVEGKQGLREGAGETRFTDHFLYNELTTYKEMNF